MAFRAFSSFHLTFHPVEGIQWCHLKLKRGCFSMFHLSQLIAMGVSGAVAILLPVILLIVWRKRTHAPFTAALCGALIFAVFALGLEQVMHYFVLRSSNFITQNLWAYVLYGSFAAGIFEETGRLVGFKLILRKQDRRETGVMYGIGHGGMEAILLVGVNMITYVVLVLQHGLLNGNGNGGMSSQVQAAMQAISASSTGTLLLSGVERIIAVAFHIALSVLVFQAAKRPGKFYLYPVAILLHAGLDSIAVLYQRGVVPSLLLTEILVGAMTVVVCFFVARAYRADVPPAVEEISQETVEIPEQNG